MPPQEIAEISGSAKERSFAESLRMESEGVPRQPTQYDRNNASPSPHLA